MSSSRPKSTLDNGCLLVEVFFDALLGDIDIVCEESVVTEEEEDLLMRAKMPAGLTRRRRGERSAKPDADGIVVKIATMAKITEVKR
mmetsp:Transcript_13085/g.18739  ORF Transcript_13085/g.18739 Transcript_13085/m.18739 type:complete len:87 (+) Transcript_13085:719-979(+)|eukprot:CAMPEP_0201697202 /NCGR_PEP_ID=MMETSP0578-20130828/9944_1 /ASSEMBLY_ACC=CAM_ASM_000663 /TAXON_ID=267565 /ORGANISM="Skeletonema grethea, Strain CCMP 1804" /LENGTH=86 /DNA_ID=CAMNT_0048183301 /DNA_START=713 /DNA_END=973 /DNA_ORIENTATION=-